jgi:hypothetical protein
MGQTIRTEGPPIRNSLLNVDHSMGAIDRYRQAGLERLQPFHRRNWTVRQVPNTRWVNGVLRTDAGTHEEYNRTDI